MCSRLSYRIKGFYCAAKRNKNSLRGEKIPHPTKEREERQPIAVTGWTDEFKPKKEIRLVLREGCGEGYKLKKRDRATRGKYKSHDKSKMRFGDVARQKVPTTASLCMCCKKNARTKPALFQTRAMQEPGTRIIHLTPSPSFTFRERWVWEGRPGNSLVKQYQTPSKERKRISPNHTWPKHAMQQVRGTIKRSSLL